VTVNPLPPALPLPLLPGAAAVVAAASPDTGTPAASTLTALTANSFQAVISPSVRVPLSLLVPAPATLTDLTESLNLLAQGLTLFDPDTTSLLPSPEAVGEGGTAEVPPTSGRSPS